MAAPVADNSLPLEPNQSKKRRFAPLSEEERNVKKKNVIPRNTQRANSNAAKTLKVYLAEIGEDQFSRGRGRGGIQPSDCEI